MVTTAATASSTAAATSAVRRGWRTASRLACALLGLRGQGREALPQQRYELARVHDHEVGPEPLRVLPRAALPELAAQHDQRAVLELAQGRDRLGGAGEPGGRRGRE